MEMTRRYNRCSALIALERPQRNVEIRTPTERHSGQEESERERERVHGENTLYAVFIFYHVCYYRDIVDRCAIQRNGNDSNNNINNLPSPPPFNK